jgi:arabinofuranosyltransferase
MQWTYSRKINFLFALIILAYAIYAAGFIYLTSAYVGANSYIPEGKRYYVLFDDAMISMRFAKNLANGDGLVWNPGGERVEGYTNPLWVGYMALVHLFGIDASKTSLVIQVTAALLLIANLVVVRRIADHLGGRPLFSLGAVVFTAFYLPLNTWSLQGMEVSVLTLMISLAAWWVLRDLAAGRFSILPYLLLGLGTGVRLDMAVPFLAVLSFMALNDPAHRARHLIAGPLILVGFLAPQFLLRRWYYGQWLPNTYYLKMEGYPPIKRFTHGFEIAGRFFVKTGVLPFGVFVFRRDRGVRLLAWLFLAQVGYSVYVGGDAWEHTGGANRYIAVAIPLLFVLLWITLDELYGWLMAGGRALAESKPGTRFDPAAVGIGIGLLALALLITFNYTYGTGALEEWLLLKPSLYSAGNGDRVRQAMLLEALTDDQASVALAGAGIVPYFVDRPYVDMLGKSDPVIAHLPMDQQYIPELKPGHMKWDYAYSIGTLKPDVVLELWVHEQDAGPYLEADYVAVWFPPRNANVWFRRESPHVYWDRLGM